MRQVSTLPGPIVHARNRDRILSPPRFDESAAEALSCNANLRPAIPHRLKRPRAFMLAEFPRLRDNAKPGLGWALTTVFFRLAACRT